MAEFVKWEGVLLPVKEKDMWSWIVHRMRRHPDERIQGYPSYQKNKYDICLKYVKDFGHALDIGAHCGFWTMSMSQDFKKVTAFEPIVENCEAFTYNVNLLDVQCEIDLYGMAVGDHCGRVAMHTQDDSSTNAKVIQGDNIIMVTIDSMDLGPISFIKVDLDGYEFPALQGMKNTLQTYKPVVIVEAKSGWPSRYGFDDDASLEFLKSIGYQIREQLREDYILTCE